MKLITLLLLTLLIGPVFAKKHYIKGIQKVTFRTGPGTDSKIIKMMEAELPVTILEVNDKWTKVKDKEGAEGYILSRFLTKDIPYSLRYKWLKNKQTKMSEELSLLKANLKEAQLQLEDKSSQYETLNKKLDTTSSAFDELKSGSSNFLKLQANFKKNEKTLTQQSTLIQTFEEKLNKHYIYWFLAGAGVLCLGWLFGIVFRKKGKASGLSF